MRLIRTSCSTSSHRTYLRVATCSLSRGRFDLIFPAGATDNFGAEATKNIKETVTAAVNGRVAWGLVLILGAWVAYKVVVGLHAGACVGG